MPEDSDLIVGVAEQAAPAPAGSLNKLHDLIEISSNTQETKTTQQQNDEINSEPKTKTKKSVRTTSESQNINKNDCLNDLQSSAKEICNKILFNESTRNGFSKNIIDKLCDKQNMKKSMNGDHEAYETDTEEEKGFNII